MNRDNTPQHVGNDEEAHVAAADVDLLEVADAAVARRHRDVLELHVHVVLGCNVFFLTKRQLLLPSFDWQHRVVMRTFDQLAAVGLARGDLEGDDVALRWRMG